jgi:hypothetical protein
VLFFSFIIGFCDGCPASWDSETLKIMKFVTADSHIGV